MYVDERGERGTDRAMRSVFCFQNDARARREVDRAQQSFGTALCNPAGDGLHQDRVRGERSANQVRIRAHRGGDARSRFEKLEPRVVSVISSVNWLCGIQWYWVERCEYLDESSYRSLGLQRPGRTGKGKERNEHSRKAKEEAD